jgi:hypothetical protein
MLNAREGWMSFTEYQAGLEFTDLRYGFKWRLEKEWNYKGKQVMWTCKAVNKQPLQDDEKDWFVGDIAESLAKV